MSCECNWRQGDDIALACSEDSGCINYLTQIECLTGECKCGEMCQNQRFQNRLYAPIEIVSTEKKGFGIRLTKDLEPDTFVYEYLGEVVGHKSFQKRLKDYADQGLRHFYFMQLQSQEYIDATKKGGFGRFLNHSCNPNCYIGKWVVGKQLRMGIFTKRFVSKGEELTFNYNVDRYGHEAQECHCGESNCVGYLGGNKQTDLGSMDELYINALGITDDVEELSLKGTKTKRSKRIDYDYVPIMKPILLRDVPKVSSAIRQSISNKRILAKLLRRILITEDSNVQKQLMRLHGFSMMSMVLNEYLENEEVVKTTLEILLKWPLITKNKIVSTNIEETVMKLSSSPSEMIQTLAAELVKMWVALEVSYRIPKERKQETEDSEGVKRKSENILDQIFSKRIRADKSSSSSAGVKLVSDAVFIKPEAAKPLNPLDIRPENLQLPLNWTFEKTNDGRPYYYHIFYRQTQWTVPTAADVERVEREMADFQAKQRAAAFDVDDIVAKAKAEAEILRLENEPSNNDSNSSRGSSKDKVKDGGNERNEKGGGMTKSRKDRHHHKKSSGDRKKERRNELYQSGSSSKTESLNEIKDRKMLKLFSAVVVSTMSRYKTSFEHDQFKRRAKELTNILCQKETRSKHYQNESYDKLSSDKESKIKSFTKDWIQKLLSRKSSSSAATPTMTSKSIDFNGDDSEELMNSVEMNSATIDTVDMMYVTDSITDSAKLTATGPSDWSDRSRLNNNEGEKENLNEYQITEQIDASEKTQVDEEEMEGREDFKNGIYKEEQSDGLENGNEDIITGQMKRSENGCEGKRLSRSVKIGANITDTGSSNSNGSPRSPKTIT
ncbi:hypothetical protein BY996DRAFT_7055791 [Phakopsora pachyrhizi]|nr:hypothetical protein BY996DRAFT_7055791 [Phakopsora pachyrhizi]